MHGCAEGHVIYGWHEDEEDKFIDLDSADNLFEIFFEEQIKNTGCTPIYGIECAMDKTTGIAKLDEKSKKIVRKAFRQYKCLKKSGGIEVKSEVGFFVGI